MEVNITRIKFNVILLGESIVGKSCLVQSLIGEKFEVSQLVTVGVESVLHKVIIDGKEFLFKIYDAGGQRYDSIASLKLKIVDGVVLVFSVDNKKSLETISKWVDKIENNVNRNEKILILVGNKIDINRRKVTTEEGMNFAKERNMKYFETSAKTGFGVDEAFNEIFQDIYEFNKKIEGCQQKENVNQNDNQRNEKIENK